MDEVLAVLAGDREAGLYQVAKPLDWASLAAVCAAQNLQLFRLDGSAIASKADLLHRCAEVMQFPDYFGGNWDALEDCLTDLEWLPARGYVLVYDQPEVLAMAAPEAWSTWIDILEFAVDAWEQTSSPMYVFFHSATLETDAIARLG